MLSRRHYIIKLCFEQKYAMPNGGLDVSN